MHKWFVYKKFDAASKAAADFIAEHIEASIRQKGECHVVLPGGNTPIICLSYLAGRNLFWDKVYWYLGDERCYPQGHAERNDVLLKKILWSRLSRTNIYTIPAELGAEKAAKVYAEVISSIEHFDIVFLGMGEDGHTASLFPRNEALNDARVVVPVYNAPKAPSERVSLGFNTLRNAHCRIVLVAGKSKADAIKRIKDGEALPINTLGDITWYIDEDAVIKNS